jgi:adenine-specific DNA methylase
VTDPPYFDSVQYSDLAAFFRVWLQQLLPTDSVETQHVASPPFASPHVASPPFASLRHYSLDDSAVKLKSNGNGTGQYRRVLSGIFVECARVLKDNGRLIFTFHHWKPKGWADLTIALKRAGFHLVNHYVVHAENPVSVHIVNQDVMLHDLILVLAKQPMKAWQLPETIQLQKGNDAFVKGCGTAVGYFLNSTLPDDDIESQWQQKLPF